MDVSVMLEQVKGNGYRATAFAPAPMVAEASTRDEAVGRLREMIQKKLSGVELIHIEIPEQDPWMAFAGTWWDHPDAAEIEQNIQEYRRKVNADPDRL